MPATSTLRLAQTSDASAIAALVRRCYGETYPLRDAFDPTRIAERIVSGREAYGLACDADGRVTGQAILVRRGDAGLFECKRVIVDRACRGQGLMGDLTRWLMLEEVPRRNGKFIFAGAVATHPFAQRNSRSLGLTPLGMLFGVYPCVSVDGLGWAEQPISVVLDGTFLGEAPRDRHLALSGTARDLAARVLDGLRVAHSGRPSRRSSPLGYELVEDDDTGFAHLKFSKMLPPMPSTLLATISLGRRLVWADVPAEHPEAPALVERLRAAGLGLGAYLPLAGPAGEDVLRLQLYLDPLELSREGIRVDAELQGLRDLLYADCLEREAVAR